MSVILPTIYPFFHRRIDDLTRVPDLSLLPRRPKSEGMTGGGAPRHASQKINGGLLIDLSNDGRVLFVSIVSSRERQPDSLPY